MFPYDRQVICLKVNSSVFQKTYRHLLCLTITLDHLNKERISNYLLHQIALKLISHQKMNRSMTKILIHTQLVP
jgi:hypothetical protein